MNKTKRPLIPAVFTAISVALFLGSLASPAFHTDHGGNDDWYGLALFLIGWLGVLGGIPAWLGNPALLAALVLLWFRRVRFLGILCALAGIGLALTFLRMKTIDYDEAGHKANIIRYGPGYWLWIASMGTAALGCFFATINDWAARLVHGGDPAEPQPSRPG